jgi:GAF domain-containing protein
MVLSGAANLDTAAFGGRDSKYRLGELRAADLPLLAELFRDAACAMTRDSILDQPASVDELSADEAIDEANNIFPNTRQQLQPGNGTQNSQGGIPVALAAANAGLQSTLASSMCFPGDDGGRSLVEMAQSDLDAALQLLADRAQYITGANGAAIALRRNGKNDMQCRASAGANVPELGALLSTEFGISGESVRTRKALRCDDAERDPRVNREGCRQLGIASVVVMPVVNDDEVLGVFELFSGKVNAFGDRDLSALQRLSEMVETAVKLARAAERFAPTMTAQALESTAADDDILGEEILDVQELAHESVPEAVQPAQPERSASRAAAIAEENLLAALEKLSPALEKKLPSASIQASGLPAAATTSQVASAAPTASAPAAAALPRKPLFWSASSSAAGAEKPAEVDQSHVPPVLRSLRSCEACGFPVSPGRALCVECEEKRWRGQLKRPVTGLPRSASQPSGSRFESKPESRPESKPESRPESKPESKSPPFDTLRAGFLAKDARNGAPAVPAADLPVGPVAHLVAVAAQTAAATAPALQRTVVADVAKDDPPQVPAVVQAIPVQEPAAVAEPAKGAQEEVKDATPELAAEATEVSSPDFVLSAGLEPPPSWIRANIFVIVVVLLVAAGVALTVLLH